MEKREKIYVDGVFIRQMQGQFGPFIKMDMKVDEMIKFLQEHRNEKGFVGITINERKTPSEKGHTHYAVLDTFVPKPREEGQPAPKQEAKPYKKPEGNINSGRYGALKTPDPFGNIDETDDLPF